MRGLDIAGLVTEDVPPELHRDFGNIRRAVPRLLVRPETVEDLQAAVEHARRLGLPLACRGHGCSSHGQSLTEGILIDTSAFDGVEPTPRATVLVGAGCTWGRLQSRLVERGLSSPVVVSNDKATLGGTLSVGGFGPASILRGAVAEQVVALDVVTGTGERIRAAPDGEYAELFAYTLCGLGRTSVIVSAEIRVEPHRPRTLLEVRALPARADLEALARSVLAEGWDQCRGVFFFGSERWKLELGRTVPDRETPAAPPGARIVENWFLEIFEREAHFTAGLIEARVKQGLLSDPEQACKIWSDFFVPAERAGELFAGLRPLFDGSLALGFNSTILNRRERARLPLLPVPEADLVLSLGAYCVLAPDRVADVRSRFDAAAEICQRLGGRQYLYGYHADTPERYRRQFGDDVMDRWSAVRRRYDPGEILGRPLDSGLQPRIR